MRDYLNQIKTRVFAFTALAGLILMAAEVGNENWGIPVLGAAILTTSILIMRSGNEN